MGSQTQRQMARSGMTAQDDLDAAVVAALEMTVPRYLRALRQAIELAEGPERLTIQQVRCLQALRAANGSVLTTGLARQFQVAVPTMTRSLDGLVERGLAKRRPDPTSRRQIQLLLTDAGRALLDRYEAVIDERLRRLLGGLDTVQKKRLLLALDDVAAMLDADTGAARPGESAEETP